MTGRSRGGAPGLGLAARNQRRARAEASRPGLDQQIGHLLQQGLLWQSKGQLWQAQESFRAVLKLQPEQSDALQCLGSIALQTGQIVAAINLFRRAVVGKRTDPGLRRQFGTALLRNEQIEAAERQLRKSLKLKPDDPETMAALATCKAKSGQVREAEQIYESLLASDPDSPPALLGYAHLLVELGNFDRAGELYRSAIQRNITPALAYAGLAQSQKFTGNPPEIDEIRRLLERPGLRPHALLALCHAAAKIANDVGRYDEAFEFASAAGEYSGKDFDPDGLARRFAGLKTLFSAEFFARHEGSGDPSRQPVFIVGMPRSGTTLTEQIIASHPQAAGAGELGALRVQAQSLGYLSASLRNKDADEREFARRVEALREKEIRAAAGEYLSDLRRVGGDARRIVDKMPQNFQFLGLIGLLLPKAKIIHCRRNPLDTCISCFMSQFVEGHDYTTDLETLGFYYRQYASLMEHWRQALPIPIHEVQYEALVADTEGEARKLIEFIGLEWDPACLRFHESSQPVFTNSRVQVRQPIYTSSVERWRRYDRHIGPLKAALGDLVERT